MSKKYVMCSAVLALIVSIFLGIVMPQELHYKQNNLSIDVNMRVDADTTVKLYYLENSDDEYTELTSVIGEASANSEFQTVHFELPTTHIEGVRIDCENPVKVWDIQNIVIDMTTEKLVLGVADIERFSQNDILDTNVKEDAYIALVTGDTDPYIMGTVNVTGIADKTINYMHIVMILAFVFVLVVLLLNKKHICSMARGVYGAKKQIILLSINDFKSRFTGSYLGVVWGVIQPLMTILLFWFVFQVGFRAAPISDAPFILWLVAGMIPWNFFSDAWLSGNGAFTGYSFIVKKVVFNVEILPLIKVAASFILNLIFNGLIIIIYTLYGRFPGVHLIDMVYFSICLTALAWGLSMITATLNVFIKDVGQFLGVAMQFLMWLTPIMWDYQIIPQSLSWMYKVNPLFYVVNGYREALIDGKWFFSNFYMMIWFWVFTILVILFGMRLMKKLRPHFADVL